MNLLTALKTALSAKGKILTAAVAADSSQISTSYIIPSVCKTVDFLNIMTYDNVLDQVTGIEVVFPNISFDF